MGSASFCEPVLPSFSLSARTSDWSARSASVIGSAALWVDEGVLRLTHCVTCLRFRSVSKTGERAFTPHRVVIDESLELARKFGSDQSAQFVNGVLDKLVPPSKRSDTATTE